MLGSDAEWLYWAIHDAANILDSGTNIPDEGRCRFNCRTQKETARHFYYLGLHEDDHTPEDWEWFEQDFKRAYKEWKRGLDGDSS